MKRILGLFLFALPLAAQVNTPTVKYVGSAPTGSCSQAPPVQVLNSSGAIYTCDNGTWAVQGGGGSGTVGAGTAGQYAQYQANGTTVSGGIATSVIITDPPYNAKCDNATDDSAAIQAALNSSAPVIALPPTNYVTSFFPICNFATPLVVPEGKTILGYNSSLDYVGAGNVSAISSLGGITLDHIFIYMQSVASNITMIKVVSGNPVELNYVDVFTWTNPGPTPAGYVALDLNGEGSVFDVYTDGPVKISGGTSGSLTGFTFADGWMNDGATTAQQKTFLISGQVFVSFRNMVVNNNSATDASACIFCIDTTGNNANTPTKQNVSFDNVAIYPATGYIGNIVSVTGTGVPAQLNGSIDTQNYTGSSLFTGTWAGTLAFGSTTYRGSAATLTYACTGGTQAGLIYTNNSSCTGGTAVATGDSVQ